MKNIYITFFWLALAICVVCLSIRVYADIKNTPVSDETPQEVSIPPETENTPLISNLIYDNNTHINNPTSTDSDNLNVSGGESRGGEGQEGKRNQQEVEGISNREESKIRNTDTRITQTEEEHIKQGNGSMYAIDIVGDGNSYFPDRYKEYFVVHIGEDERLGDYIIIRHDKERWVYGHTQTTRQAGDYIHTEKDGKVLGQYNKSGMSSAPHLHIERWTCPTKESKMKDCKNVSSEGTVAPRNRQLIEQRGWGEQPIQSQANILEAKEVDLDKLAYAVAMAETTGCTKGTALSKMNCHGIKSGNTYPCKSPKRTMCVFGSTEESYEAFKVIWGKWYKTFPTREMAVRWTGADNADLWLYHVTLYYNK